MVKGVEISTNEQAYILESLKNGFRVDGRKLDESRKPEIKISEEEYGYVELTWGLTKLSIRVSCEIENPFEDRPFEGIFNINTEISSMASSQFENGKNSDDEILISRLIEKAIRRSNALDLENLCIIAGSKVWSIRVDLNFLNYDGGLIDASSIGVMTALSHFKKPDISINGEEIIIHSYEERQPIPLSILHIPICVSFSFFNPNGKEENIKGELNEEISIIDANQREELIRDGNLVITINKNRELIQLSKNGGLPIDAIVLMNLSKEAYKIAELYTDLIKDLIKKNEEIMYKKLNLKLLEVGVKR